MRLNYTLYFSNSFTESPTRPAILSSKVGIASSLGLATNLDVRNNNAQKATFPPRRSEGLDAFIFLFNL